MTGLLGKLFGKKSESKPSLGDLIEDVILGLIEKGQFEIAYEMEVISDENTVNINLFGDDENLLKARDGQMLDAIQLLLTRVVQHQMPEEKIRVNVDCDGFREEANAALVKLAEKLKGIVLKKKKSVYFRALPPKDRKIIHQYLADDDRIKSHSVGEGLYKKIKIYPSKGVEEAVQD